MTIDTSIIRIGDLNDELATYFKDKIDFTKYELGILRNSIKHYLDKLRDDLWLYIEYPYTDRVFRDSYYHYFSSKSTEYHRHCIRIALFGDEISELDFRTASTNKVQDIYLGFFVIRPLLAPIGRNVISPKALKVVNFSCCTTKFSTLINGKKLEVLGFPHLSQDSETHSCAESTIWATMEYFSHRYPEYRPVLPSEIIGTLKKISYERQIPSNGLSLEHISFALKEYGFGTKIYTRNEYSESDLRMILSTYIESGIPVTIGIQSKTIGHAIIAIGRENINSAMINGISQTPLSDSLNIFDFSTTNKQLVFFDDNFGPYQKAHPKKPTEHYQSDEWKECRIFCFVAPLHPKIYLEAYAVKKAIYSILKNYSSKLEISDGNLIRYFLTSSRSYKNSVSSNSTYSDNLKEIILSIALPKFIWICELSTKDSYINDKCHGLILIDATEPNAIDTKPIIFFLYNDKFINFAPKFSESEDIILYYLSKVECFSPYKNNLNTYN
ncbi:MULTISPECIES: hypothetical protein [Emticicia]|uniref:hypothetical protein n=1 Tax=Emticicia TaxID=312278 RepID=UPI000C75C6CE|nr:MULTISPECIES: hypothetical protein [Emticicia]PLK44408.1 hypothetical protein C0V77_11525 [Emticicia sp. TH156]